MPIDKKRKLKVSIIGSLKIVDNNILLMNKTLGFNAAVEPV